MDKVLLTPKEAAAALGIGRSKLYQLLASGRLTSVQIGTCRRVPVAAVEEFVRSLRPQPGRETGGREEMPQTVYDT